MQIGIDGPPIAFGARMRSVFVSIVLVTIVGCASQTSPEASDEAQYTEDAHLKFDASFGVSLSGTPTAGRALVVDYALDRLMECKGNVGGGAPAWNVTGYLSENGGAPKIFEVSELSESGDDRVTKPARVPLSEGGDVALWFQISNRWGCVAYDSAFGQNFHFPVKGAPPEATSSLVFKADGSVDRSGDLRAGGKVKIRYEQERLPKCRRTERGNPAWTISGFAALNGAKERAFDTGRADGSERVPVDAFIELPEAGELALWFQVSSLGGCSEYDSKDGQNYRFAIAP